MTTATIDAPMEAALDFDATARALTPARSSYP